VKLCLRSQDVPADNAGDTLVQKKKQVNTPHLLWASDWVSKCALLASTVLMQETYKIYTEEAKW